MKSKQKPLTLVASLIAGTMLLTGCTQGEDPEPTESPYLEDQQVEVMPQWDVRELVPGSWYVPEGSPVPTAPEEISNPENIPGMTDDVFLPNWVTFLDDETGCRITGRTLYLPGYTEGRGDDFNTREYLYSTVPLDSEYGTITKETINEMDYLVMDHFIAPSDDAEAGWHHRLAARAFSGALPMEGMDIGDQDPGSDHGSSLLEGQPLAYIDFSCEDEADLTQERWDAGVKLFSLLFSNPTAPPSEPANVDELGADTQP